MKDKTITSGINVLGIRISGSGAYVKEQLAHLQDFMDYVKFDELEDLRQSYE